MDLIKRCCLKRKCKICKYPISDESTIKTCDNSECKMAFAKAHIRRRREQKRKEERKRIKEEKINLMTLHDWKKVFQSEINKIVRLLDEGMPCIIKGTKARMDVSHYAF